MTIQINIAKAKGALSDLVARAEAGEKVVLARNGKPVAEIKPVASPAKGKRLGFWKHLGELEDPDMFHGTDPEIEPWIDAPIFPEK